ncbi:hypothetical protein VF10_38435 [Nostoc linckia z13]|nr:hypothetical protein VF10_38435 [Nostoc linckia z13]
MLISAAEAAPMMLFFCPDALTRSGRAARLLATAYRPVWVEASTVGEGRENRRVQNKENRQKPVPASQQHCP